jgi:Na+/melibiose symporter-like transporter
MLSELKIILYSLGIAFFVSRIVIPPLKKKFHKKPFSCMKCMTAWVSLILALFNHYGFESIGLMFFGLMAGLIVDNAMYRYL